MAFCNQRMLLPGRILILFAGCLLIGGLRAQEAVSRAPADDPYLWLEDITGPQALAWVRQQNAISARELEAVDGFSALQQRLLQILDSEEKIPFITRHGDYFYNFWRDANHERGIWRRTTLAEYRKPEPHWEIVLDLDALAKQEAENWVWKGAEVLYPSYGAR